MNRTSTNEAFTYVLPYANSEDSGVSIPTEKRNASKHLYQDDVEVTDIALIWQLQQVKQNMLFTNEKKYQLRTEMKDSQVDATFKSMFCFGTADACK